MLQLCLRCGRHEQTGSYCTWCRTASYDLADHKDPSGTVCSLGPHLDPIPYGRPAIKKAIREYFATRHLLPEGFPTRHHPRAIGYTEESDPPAPAWMAQMPAAQPLRGHPDPKDVQVAA